MSAPSLPTPLPIDERLPAIVETVRQRGALVLVAEPGAGKTTRVPAALLDARVADGEIVVLEPRRLAARMAARRVAEERGEPVGETVGYTVRFDDCSSPRTRLRFVTEGVLTQRLRTDPRLDGVGAVVLDEFHERHLDSDLALALLARLRRTTRPSLRLVVMSATIDADPIARFLDAEVVRVAGRTFPVEVEHADERSPWLQSGSVDPRELPRAVAGAVQRLVASSLDGHALVFLPGAGEIRRAMESCGEVARAASLDLVPLHGDLPPTEQDRAVRAARAGERRRVILATNVAETSLTIPGVVAVVDAGLARVARHSPWSGLPSLQVEKVSQASAAQRAGRAGRTAPGRCLRLYTRHDHDGRPRADLPEILRADLAEALLALSVDGIALDAAASVGADAIRWLDPPPPAALAAARDLLERLGALDGSGAATSLGRALARLPLHPRLARLVVAAAERGAASRGCLAAALLAERDLRRPARVTFDGGRGGRGPALATTVGSSDLVERIEAFESALDRRGRLDADAARRAELDVGAALSVERAASQLRRLVDARGHDGGRSKVDQRSNLDQEQALLVATLAAFPDRVGRRRAAGSPQIVFSPGSGGGAGELSPSSVVRDAKLLVAVEAEDRRGQSALIRVASEVRADWLLDLFPDRLAETVSARFDAAAERVERIEALTWDGLVLDETRRNDAVGPEVSEALAEAALARGVAHFVDGDALARLLARTRFVAAHRDGFPALDDAAARDALVALCEGRRSFAELRDADLVAAVAARLPPADRALLERWAPERLQLPGGRRARIEYADGQAPWIESRLQDFFGMTTGPRVADGRVPLVIHLLAPNQRAVQVTTDLAGFWERHYPTLRKQLMRRYPKHSWPDDPSHAEPPQRR